MSTIPDEPDLGGVLSAATDYGDARAAVEKARGDEALAVQAQTYEAALAELQAEYDAYVASHPDAEPPPDPEPVPVPAPLKVIGMSSPANLWAQRLGEVGPQGVKARRIFADLTSTGRDQSALIEAAVAAGMLPVISWKVPNVATLISGGYDAWLATLKTYLTGLGVQVTATFWHEPHGDMTPADFRAGSRKFLDQVKAPTVAVGPILNGWLLDNRVADFTSYTDAALLADWDFVAIDTYQSGTPTAPGSTIPGDRIGPLLEVLDAAGVPDKPIGVGEYNGYSADVLARSGEVFLSTGSLWFACCWNSSGGKGVPLSGDRLEAFKATKSDPRAAQ